MLMDGNTAQDSLLASKQQAHHAIKSQLELLQKTIDQSMTQMKAMMIQENILRGAVEALTEAKILRDAGRPELPFTIPGKVMDDGKKNTMEVV
jgi:hypothetical protein